TTSRWSSSPRPPPEHRRRYSGQLPGHGAGELPDADPADQLGLLVTDLETSPGTDPDPDPDPGAGGAEVALVRMSGRGFCCHRQRTSCWSVHGTGRSSPSRSATSARM